MNDSKISVRYSRALFQAALEKNLLDEVTSDMKYISELLKLPEIKEFIEHPVIPPSRKSETFSKLLGGKVQDITMSLVELLVQNGRESYLPAITRSFVSQTRKHKGITEAFLTTAVPVESSVKKEIADMIAGVFSTKVEIREVIDPDIIGGFILRVDDSYIDASVRNKLRKVKKELLGSITSV